MNQRTTFRIATVWLIAAIAGVHVSVGAQTATEKNPPRRLPPTGSQATDIPAGVDTGSPTTGNHMPLGMPVPPALAPDREDQNKRSAAARAAARPLATTPLTADRVAPGPAALGAQTDSRDPGATLPRGQRPVARRDGVAGADCLSGKGRASSASLATASAVARGPTSRPC